MEIVNGKKKRQPRPSIDLTTMVYGKVPPQAKDLEEVVLGTLLNGTYPHLFDEVFIILKPGSFYLDIHNRVFTAMQTLNNRNIPIETPAVAEELRRTEQLDLVGGPHAILRLTKFSGAQGNVLHYCRIIFQKFLQREVIRIAGEAIGMAYEDSTDAFELINEMESNVSRLLITGTSQPYKKIGEAMAVAVKKVYEMKVSEDPNKWLTGVPTGWPLFDRVTQGLQPTNFIVLAARPSVGKSAVGANLARNAATHPVKPTKVGIFSLEMSTDQWAMRILAADVEIDRLHLKRGDITDDQMKEVQTAGMLKYAEAPIFLDDTPGLNMYELMSKARRMVNIDGVGLILVDYLQLLSSGTKEENRNAEIEKISRDLKRLAKELKVPVVALSQLSRKGATADPNLTDLRGSGSIEQDADDVWFITAPSEDEVKGNDSLRDRILINGGKHRDGVLQDIPLRFVKSIQKIFTDQQYEDFCHRTGYNLKPEEKGKWKKIPKQEDLFNDKTTTKK